MTENKGILDFDPTHLVLGDFVSLLLQYKSALTSQNERFENNG
jgi:hypothetical protein